MSSLTEDIDRLSKRLEAIPSSGLPSASLTRRVYVCNLLRRASQLAARDQYELSSKLVSKVNTSLYELEASLQDQKRQAEQQLAIIEEDYEPVSEDAKSLFTSTAYFYLTHLFNKVKHKKSAEYFEALIHEMASLQLNASLSDQAEISRSQPKQTELQSFQQYQTMFEKMALDRLLARVMKEIPQNAGPLNPERLLIRSFKVLQDISPDYLSQLISYYESLLTLQTLNNSDK